MMPWKPVAHPAAKSICSRSIRRSPPAGASPGIRRSHPRPRATRASARAGIRAACAVRTDYTDKKNLSLRILSPRPLIPDNRSSMSPLQDYLSLPYEELEELNLDAKEQRTKRVPADRIQEE